MEFTAHSIELPDGTLIRERKKAPSTSKTAAQRWAEARERVLLVHGKPKPVRKEEVQEKPTLKEFAPRLGLAYALDDQSKTVVRAGYGIFYGRYPGGLINTLILGNGVYQKSITFNSGTASDKAAGPVFPLVLPTNSSTYNPPPGSVNLNIASKDFRSPYTQQGDIAVERQLAAHAAELCLTGAGYPNPGAIIQAPKYSLRF